jgi:hypothetical protein
MNDLGTVLEFEIFALLSCYAALIGRKIPEERRSHLHRGGSLKSRPLICLDGLRKSTNTSG